jgi:hypothetical protein
MEEREAEITISGRELTFAQSLTVRVALGHFAMWLTSEDSELRDDQLAKNYLERINELNKLIALTCK